MTPPVKPPSSSQAAAGGGSPDKSNMAALDALIRSGQTINYKGKDLKDDRNVAQFTADHRPLKTAMLGTMLFLYTDPCHCCLPAHGERDCKPDIADATGVIDYVRKAKESGKPLDVLFTSHALYKQVKDPIAKIAPETKIIVACARRTDTKASDLRKQDIPAIDDDDYLNCSPLNAVIALTVFNETMSA
jgi:hypothetical protein